MVHQIWADYPFPLISTPALDGDVPALIDDQYLDPFARSATKMALAHNVIIRGMNSIYLQCEHITPQNAASFLLYCQCWSEFIQNHHACEEVAYFPIIEKATGVEGLSDGNLEQHDAFLGGLQKFDEYINNVSPQKYCGKTVLRILDSFAATLQSHLTDEVVWILTLSRFQDLDIGAIDNYHRGYVQQRQSQSKIMPFMLTNHDVSYESGIHANWPFAGVAEDVTKPNSMTVSAVVKEWWLRYVCTLVHRNAWRFSCCSYGGKPRVLEGTKKMRSLPSGPRPAHTRDSMEMAEQGYMPFVTRGRAAPQDTSNYTRGDSADTIARLKKPERVLTR